MGQANLKKLTVLHLNWKTFLGLVITPLTERIKLSYKTKDALVQSPEEPASVEHAPPIPLREPGFPCTEVRGQGTLAHGFIGLGPGSVPKQQPSPRQHTDHCCSWDGCHVAVPQRSHHPNACFSESDAKGLQVTRKPVGYCEINHQKETCWKFCWRLCPHVGKRGWVGRRLSLLPQDDQSLKEMHATFKETQRRKGGMHSNHLTTYFCSFTQSPSIEIGHLCEKNVQYILVCHMPQVFGACVHICLNKPTYIHTCI